MEGPIAWLMTVVAAAGMTAYADGLEKRVEPPQSLRAQAAKPKLPDPRCDSRSEASDTYD